MVCNIYEGSKASNGGDQKTVFRGYYKYDKIFVEGMGYILKRVMINWEKGYILFVL